MKYKDLKEQLIKDCCDRIELYETVNDWIIEDQRLLFTALSIYEKDIYDKHGFIDIIDLEVGTIEDFYKNIENIKYEV